MSAATLAARLRLPVIGSPMFLVSNPALVTAQCGAGIVGAFQDFCVKAGVPAISIWAAVPHYVAQPPSPKATLALLHRVEEVLDVEVPLAALPGQAEEWERTVSEMADEDEDIRNYVRALEERGDDALTETSGEAIAAEFERYLRRRGRGPSV